MKQTIFKMLIVFLLLIFIFLICFNLGRQFYSIKNTLQNNIKIKYETSILRWKFDVKFKVDDEEIKID